MKKDWLIIADDLTGAADCAIAYGKRGLRAFVSWGDVSYADRKKTRIFSYNADNRLLPVVETIMLYDQLLEKFWMPDLLFFKKIDSTLRGQVAAEIAVTMDFLKQKTGYGFGIMAPAFPATGRVTRGGKIFIDEVPLEQTNLWQRDHAYPSSDLCTLIQSGCGISCHLIGLEEVRGDLALLEARLDKLEQQKNSIVVLDAETDEDLNRIARAAASDNPSRFFIGSAGLAHAFARFIPPKHRKALFFEPKSGGNLIIVGSLAYISCCAARKLIVTRDVHAVELCSDTLLEDPEILKAIFDEIADLLSQGKDVLLNIKAGKNMNPLSGPLIIQKMSHYLLPVISFLGGLILTGGETASIVMNSFGMKAISLFDEIEAGIALGLSKGAVQIPIVTKAGAFGNSMSLVQSLDRIRAVRKEGCLR